MTTLFIGNLPPQTTHDDLRAAFEAHGRVRSAGVVTDDSMGGSRGFGFVEMISDERARAAMDELNGLEVDGYRVEVREAGSWPGEMPHSPQRPVRGDRAPRQVA